MYSLGDCLFRARTTSLHDYLHQHPDIFMSRLKEPYFFTRCHPAWVEIAQERSAYLALFGDAGEARYRGEALPAYLSESDVPGGRHARAGARRGGAGDDARTNYVPWSPPAPVALTGRPAARARRSTCRSRLLEGLLQRGLDVAHRQAAQERRDDRRLQGVGARHVLAEDPLSNPSFWALRTRGRSSCTGPLVATTVRDKTARSGLLSPCGRTPISFDSSGQSGGYARPPFTRPLGRHLGAPQ
jgi:hypothetical protein